MALQNLGIGLVIGGTLASSFRSSFNTANTGITALGSNINKLSNTRLDIKNFRRLSRDAITNRTALRQLASSLKKAGVDVRHLEQDSRLLNSSLRKLKKAAKISIKIESNKAAFAQQKASILGLGASLYGVTRMIKSANKVLKAQGEIRSLDISTDGIDAITKAGLNMSLKFGQITAPEFIKASYDIKSGIASLSDSGVKDFTKFAATTAVATKASTADMTKLYALGYGIFRQDFSSDTNFGKQFSGAIAGAVQAFRTDGSDLAAGISNIGASAHAMGISLQEELAIIGLSKSAFASASEAGSGYRAFLDGTGKAQKALGLKFTDSAGKMLPMVDILGLIKGKFGSLDLSEINALKTAFGSTEAIKTITALLPKVDALKQAQIDLESSMAGGLTKAQDMANAMDSGYGFEKMGNALAYLSFTIGKSLAPAVDALASGLGGLAKGVAWLDDKVPFLIPVFSGLALGVLGLVTVMKVATLTKLGFQTAVLSVRRSVLISTASNRYNSMSFNRIGLSSVFAKGKILAFSAASKLAAGAQWLFNAALLANPISAVIAGVAIAATLVYKYWQPIKAFMGGVWDGFVAGLEPVFTALSPLKPIFSDIGNAIGSVIGWIGDLFAPVQQTGTELSNLANTGKMVGNVIAGAFNIALAPIKAIIFGIGKIGDAYTSVKGFFGFGDSQPVIEPVIKPKKKLMMATAVGAMAVSSIMAMAQPIPKALPLPAQKAPIVQVQAMAQPIPKALPLPAQKAPIVQVQAMAQPIPKALPLPAQKAPIVQVQAMAQPIPKALPLPAQKAPIVQVQPMPKYIARATQSSPVSAPKKQTLPAQQHFNIKVVVNNPSRNVDVETAIVAAMKKQSTEISLNDEVL